MSISYTVVARRSTVTLVEPGGVPSRPAGGPGPMAGPSPPPPKGQIKFMFFPFQKRFSGGDWGLGRRVPLSFSFSNPGKTNRGQNQAKLWACMPIVWPDFDLDFYM